MRRCVSWMTCLAMAAGCAHSPTAPSEDRRLTSALGYHVEAQDDFLKAGRVVTPAHGELADRWWGELMADLAAAGFGKADPTNIRGYMYIRLHQPVDDQGLILNSSGVKVGGYYDVLGQAFHVPGDYPTAHWRDRPSMQALKHEMLHHWCRMTLGHLCLAPGKSEWDGHVWPVPNDPNKNIWDFTWH